MSKKAKIILGVIIAVVILILIVTVTHGKSEDKIQGSWQISQLSIDSADFDNYPENVYLTFLENGTGYFDGNINDVFYYSINDSTVTIDCDNWILSYTYDFEIKGNELTLEFVGDNPIYYNKVDTTEITTVEHTTKSRVFKTVEGEERWSN